MHLRRQPEVRAYRSLPPSSDRQRDCPPAAQKSSLPLLHVVDSEVPESSRDGVGRFFSFLFFFLIVLKYANKIYHFHMGGLVASAY